MKGLAIMMGLILVGIVLLNSSKKNYNSHLQQGEENSYDDLIGQEALKHL